MEHHHTCILFLLMGIAAAMPAQNSYINLNSVKNGQQDRKLGHNHITTPPINFVCPKEDIAATLCLGPFDCLYVDPDDCAGFIKCIVNIDLITGTPHKFKCPFGLEWNDKEKLCDWPSEFTCQKVSSTIGIITSTKSTTTLVSENATDVTRTESTLTDSTTKISIESTTEVSIDSTTEVSIDSTTEESIDSTTIDSETYITSDSTINTTIESLTEEITENLI